MVMISAGGRRHARREQKHTCEAQVCRRRSRRPNKPLMKRASRMVALAGLPVIGAVMVVRRGKPGGAL